MLCMANNRVYIGGRGEIGRVYLPLSWRVHHKLCKWCWIEWKGAGRAPPTLTSLGRFSHRNGMYARKWPLPLCLHSVWQTIPSREKCYTVHDALFLVERKAVHDICFLWKGMLYIAHCKNDGCWTWHVGVAGSHNASLQLLFLVERNAVHIVWFLVGRNVMHVSSGEKCL